MRCQEFKARLDVQLDKRLPPLLDPNLRAHSLECPECCAWLDTSAAVLSALESTRPLVSRPEFSISVLQSFESGQRDRRRSRRLALVGGLSAMAVAATLLLAILSWGPESRFKKSAPTVQSQSFADINYEQILVSASAITSHHSVWMSELAEGLRPATSSVNSAIHTLLRTLPASELAHVLL